MDENNINVMKEYIKEHEGLRLKRYKCPTGHWTIGYGHLILEHENYKNITLEQANEIFEKDFQKHYEQAKLFPNFDELPFSKQCVIVDMCFNLGGNFFYKWPKFTKYMTEGNYVAAANEIKNSKYYKQVGNRAKNNIYLILK